MTVKDLREFLNNYEDKTPILINYVVVDTDCVRVLCPFPHLFRKDAHGNLILDLVSAP